MGSTWDRGTSSAEYEETATANKLASNGFHIVREDPGRKSQYVRKVGFVRKTVAYYILAIAVLSVSAYLLSAYPALTGLWALLLIGSIAALFGSIWLVPNKYIEYKSDRELPRIYISDSAIVGHHDPEKSDKASYYYMMTTPTYAKITDTAIFIEGYSQRISIYQDHIEPQRSNGFKTRTEKVSLRFPRTMSMEDETQIMRMMQANGFFVDIPPVGTARETAGSAQIGAQGAR